MLKVRADISGLQILFTKGMSGWAPVFSRGNSYSRWASQAFWSVLYQGWYFSLSFKVLRHQLPFILLHYALSLFTLFLLPGNLRGHLMQVNSPGSDSEVKITSRNFTEERSGDVHLWGNKGSNVGRRGWILMRLQQRLRWFCEGARSWAGPWELTHARRIGSQRQPDTGCWLPLRRWYDLGPSSKRVSDENCQLPTLPAAGGSGRFTSEGGWAVTRIWAAWQ